MGFEWSKRVQTSQGRWPSGDEIRRIAQDLGIRNFAPRMKEAVSKSSNQVPSAYQDVLAGS